MLARSYVGGRQSLVGHLRYHSQTAEHPRRLHNAHPHTRRIAGHSPKAIIDRHIMEAIEKELKSSTRTIQEIAYAYGFSSQAHLTRFFKKYRGMSPTAFRKA